MKVKTLHFGLYRLAKPNKQLCFKILKYDMGGDSGKEAIDMDNRSKIYAILMNDEGEDLAEKSITDLREIANESDGQSRYFARAILSFGKSSSTDDESANEQKLVVLPNPTDYQVLFDWSDYQLTDEVVIIEITDQQGSLVQMLSPASGQVSQEWTTELISGSVCYYRLLINGQEKENGQIVINK